MPVIQTMTPCSTHLRVVWSDDVESIYPWLWLRDHAHDEATMHPLTQQRQLYSAAVPAGITAAHVTALGDAVVITWARSDERSELPIAFLERFRRPAPAIARLDTARPDTTVQLWDASSMSAPPAVPYDAIIGGDDGVVAWLRAVARFGFCIATGTPATAGATEALIRRVGYIRETIFGGFFEFTADMSKADTAYTNLALRPHTDGTYAHDAPGLQLLHCLFFDGEGGETTIVDGFRVADEIRAATPRVHEVLSTVAIPGQYIGDGVHLMSARPVLRHDHSSRLVQVSFNNSDRAPFLLPAGEMVELYEALRAFDLALNDERFQWRHVLRPGEALLFDNWRVLHGRTAYTGRRQLCGAYLNHEDFESRLRLLATAP